ncbi:kinase-like domain-containing protein [Russula earlei]|uniref:Kinase-like domain-containing protein n=1 Tax=Russula earlei TaxID=71964 RepID=A0ACC0U8K2_9AGAM|nr:kinase-like domain-containing protein [Russula earlei]
MSDFHLRIRSFPHLVLEVSSSSSETDKHRMLLQASCLARIGNNLRKSDDAVTIMAIYVDSSFQAVQHLVNQPNTSTDKVQYITQTFNLTAPKELFQFLFQLYNFAFRAKFENDTFDNPTCRLQDAKANVERNTLPSLVSGKKHQRDTDAPRSYRRQSAPGGANDSFDNPSVQDDVVAAGYKIPILPEGLTLLTPPTVCKATSRSGLSVVLKLLGDDDQELEFLEYLSNIKEATNHTIPLHDIIKLSIGRKAIVLPWGLPLDEVLQFNKYPDDVVPLCQQFIEGVLFLHDHNVAHCDLKPGNVVIASTYQPPQLYIIDFDLAEFVESEETMIESWCGTPPWIAPEVGTRDGPVQRYSPILADRWACGQMIAYFAKDDPRARPSLSSIKLDGTRKRRLEESRGERALKRGC